MILNTSERISLFCCLKLTLISFAIVLLNSLSASGLIASEPAQPASFTINLSVCIKDENGKPAVKRVDNKDVPVSFTIVGGAAVIKPAGENNGCSSIGDQKFTASKEYIILVSTQNENGVRIAMRQFDPALFKSELNTEPQPININLKDGVAVYNKDGKEIFYSKTPQGSDSRNTEGSAAVNDPNDSGENTETGVSTGNGNRPNGSDSGYPLWMMIAALFIAGAPTFLFTRWLYKSPPSTLPETVAQPLDREYFLEVANLHNKIIIAAIKANASEAESETTAPPAETQPSSSQTQNPETFQTEESGFSESENSSASDYAKTTFGRDSNEFQINDAQEYYIKIKNGVRASYIELQPTGESSPEHMLGNQGIRLSEQQGGKYIAFPVREKSNEFWVFPDPGLNFSETAFSQVFPELTRENFESGAVTPRKAVRQYDGGSWLIQ